MLAEDSVELALEKRHDASVHMRPVAIELGLGDALGTHHLVEDVEQAPLRRKDLAQFGVEAACRVDPVRVLMCVFVCVCVCVRVCVVYEGTCQHTHT